RRFRDRGRRERPLLRRKRGTGRVRLYLPCGSLPLINRRAARRSRRVCSSFLVRRVPANLRFFAKGFGRDLPARAFSEKKIKFFKFFKLDCRMIWSATPFLALD